MLACNLDNVLAHDYRSERFRKAYDFLRRTDLASLPLGRIDIDGDEVFANVQEYDTVPEAEKDLEAHRRYFDVQFVVFGEELVQVAPLEGLPETAPFDEAADSGSYETPADVTALVLRSGDMAVLAPEEAHKPGCSVDALGCRVRKIVVKVLV